MAGLKGNQAYVAWSKQTAKGTPNTTYAYKSPFAGGNIAPTRVVDQLSETDANRDEGVSYISQTAVEGSPEIYVRDKNISSLLYATLGTDVVTGAASDYTHTITPSNTLPYLTFARGIGGTLWEQFNDCQVNELTISADTGGPLTASVSVMGTEAKRLLADPTSVSPVLASDSVYNFNEATVTIDGAATSLVSSFELTISNNVTLQQTDSSIPYDVVAGQRSVTLSYDMIFETLESYNKFHYLTTSGTAQSSVLSKQSVKLEFSHGAKNSISFEVLHAAVEEMDVDPDPGGDPIVIPVRVRAQRNTADPVMTAIVLNQVATF